MFEVVERFTYSYGEDMPRVHQDVYIAGPFATIQDAENYIGNTDPYDEHNLMPIDIGDPGEDITGELCL